MKQSEALEKSKLRRSRIKKFFKFLISIFAIECLSVFIISRYLSTERLTPNRDIEIDAVIVVSGGDVRVRTEEGVKIFETVEDGDTKLVFSGDVFDEGQSNAEWMRDLAISQGINPDKILIETRAANTFENAKFSKDLLRYFEIKNIIVITSPYHIRRTQVTFDEIFGDKFKIYYLSTDECFFDCVPDYFSFHQYFRLVEESVKLVYYGITGNLG